MKTSILGALVMVGALVGCNGAEQAASTTLTNEVRAQACSFGELAKDSGHVSECNFRVNDLEGNARCFENQAHACGCAGCDSDACVILESYPAQVRCQ